ncbi:MAG TPA: hypothetical protein VM011_11160 [Gammaproteobacteria bacterium]|jgi:hypothetical protein|nr:hypothetical protein [Gammaproteobacteria bacterium]
MNTKHRSLLAAVVAFTLAVPGMASADRRGDGYRDHGDRHGYSNHGYKKQYRGQHDDRRGYYRDGHRDYRGHNDRHVTRYYRQDNDHDDLLLGLVVGGVLGYTINGAQYNNRYNYYGR